MSEIKVNSIKGVGASAAAITVNNSDGTCTANLTSISGDAFGSRNVLINSAMQISQRGTSDSGITSSEYPDAPDRWRFGLSGQGTWTISQDTSAPAGFANSWKAQCTTADASPSTTDLVYMHQKIEGYNVQKFAKGTVSAKTFTVSFYVKTNKAGTYICELWDRDNDRAVSQTYTVSSSNASSANWVRYTCNFPADTTGAFGNDNGNSLELNFWLGAGSQFTSGTLATAWASRTQANRVVGQVNLADNTSNYWQITGVQLEVGSVATDFEHRSFGQELALCKRYYNRFTAGSIYTRFASGQVQSSDQAEFMFQHPVTMRAAPTFGSGGALVGWSENSLKTISSIALNDPNVNNCTFTATTSGCTRGTAIDFIANNSATAYIEFISEL